MRTPYGALVIGTLLALGVSGARPAVVQAQAQAPSRPNLLGPPYLEAMTWTEIRDAIAGGKRTVIIPTGGTEQNGPHMVMGKHNYIVTFAAGQMAERLGTP